MKKKKILTFCKRPRLTITLQTKMFITYMIVVVLLTTTLGSILISNIHHKEIERYDALLKQVAHSVSESVDDSLSSVQHTSTVYLITEEVTSAIKNDFYKGDIEYIKTIRYLEDHIRVAKTNPFIRNITYMSNSGEQFSGSGASALQLAQLQMFKEEMLANNEAAMLTPVYNTTLSTKDVSVITYIFTVKEPYTFLDIGHAFITIDLEYLYSRDISIGSHSEFNMLAIQNGRVVYCNGDIPDTEHEQIVAHTNTLEKSAKSHPFTIQGESDKRYCVAQYNDTMDMMFVASISGDSIAENSGSVVDYYLLTGFIFIAASGVLLLLTMWVARPIRELLADINNMGDTALLPIKEPKRSNDDLILLVQTFNDMTVRLKTSIANEYTARDLQHEAQLKVLQNQVNPHFLYNTLNAISSIAEVEDVPEIATLSANIANMFRYNIYGQTTTLLHDELEQSMRYLEIHKMCVHNHLKIKLCAPIDTTQYSVMKFMLQPLVENCIKHGFANGTREGTVIICVQLSENGKELCFTVEDDGVGMSQERLCQLQQECAVSCTEYTLEKTEQNIGVLNVNFRLKGYYGDTSGLCIESNEHGTSISWSIPALPNNAEQPKEDNNEIHYS